jgi:Glycosyl transferases group 1
MRPFSRLFALAPDCHAAGNRYARLWQRHFYDGLRGVAPEVAFPREVDFTWARPASAAANGSSPERTAMSQRLREQIRSSGPEAVLSYAFASDIDPALVRDTVAMGIPWINFFCDSTYAFDRVEALAREASLNWFPESAAEPSYRALGRPWLCRPYALNPDALPEASCVTAVHRLGFVGAPTETRVLRLAALAALGCRVSVRGEGWRPQPRSAGELRPGRASGGVASRIDLRKLARLPRRMAVRALRALVRAGGRLDDDALTRFVSECRLMLGLNEGGAGLGSTRSYLKLRDVEFPGYGACYLTQHNADVARAFDVGREVLTFRRLAEAVAIARDYAAHPAEARAVGRAGRRRVLAEHTWSTRLGEIARAL